MRYLSTNSLTLAAFAVLPPLYLTALSLRLEKTYPILPSSPPYSHLPVHLSNLLSPHPLESYIVARIHLTNLPISSSPPLDRVLSVFWSAWTLRVEAFLARQTGYSSRGPPHDFASGIFITRWASPEAILVEWKMPRPVVWAFKKMEIGMVRGGVQELSVRKVEEEEGGGRWEIGYGTAEHFGGEDVSLGRLGLELHRFYMRWLLDGTVRRLQKEGMSALK